jgi:putative heme transporter
MATGPRWWSRVSPRTWARLRFVVGLALAALAFEVLNGQRNELLDASARLANLNVGWLLIAIASEVVSLVSFAMLQRRLLRSGGVDIDLGYMVGVTFASAAIADSVPAGPAFALVYAFRRYRRRGADDALAGWTLLATLVCAALALGLLATAGVAIAAQEGAAYGLVGVVLGVLVISVVADAIVWQRQWLASVAVRALNFSRRLVRRPRREAIVVVEDLLARLSAVKLTWRDLFVTLGYAFANWAFDCGCLAASFFAVDAPVPWRALLLAYGAGQLAANLPITPGGLGVVEGSLTIALVAFGGGEVSTVAAVLCYRIVSFWGFLPIGWGSFGTLALLDRRRGQARLEVETADTSVPSTLRALVDTETPATVVVPAVVDQGDLR